MTQRDSASRSGKRFADRRFSLALAGLLAALGGGLVAASALAAEPVVRIVDFAFKPARITIVAGQAVTWRQDGAAMHTVTADDGSFDSGELAPKDQFANVFEVPGTYTYRCSLHPDRMKGTVIVKAAAKAPTPPGSPEPTPPPGTLPPDFSPYPATSTEPSPGPSEAQGDSGAAPSGSPIPGDRVDVSDPTGVLAVGFVVLVSAALAVFLAIRRRSNR